MSGRSLRELLSKNHPKRSCPALLLAISKFCCSNFCWRCASKVMVLYVFLPKKAWLTKGFLPSLRQWPRAGHAWQPEPLGCKFHPGSRSAHVTHDSTYVRHVTCGWGLAVLFLNCFGSEVWSVTDPWHVRCHIAHDASNLQGQSSKSFFQDWGVEICSNPIACN